MLGKEHILTKERIRQRKIRINCDHCSRISRKGVAGRRGGGAEHDDMIWFLASPSS